MQHYIGHSLMKRFMTMIIILCVLVVCAFAVMYAYVNSYSYNASVQLMSNMLTQAETRVNEYFRTIENAAYLLCYTTDVQSFLQLDDIRDRIDYADRLRAIHSGTFTTVDSLIGIGTFAMDGKSLHSSGIGLYSIDGLPPQYLDITGYVYSDYYDADRLDGQKQGGFTMITTVYSFDTSSRLLGKKLGLVAFTFDNFYLSSILTESKEDAACYLLLADGSGNLLACNNTEASAYYRGKGWEQHKPAAQMSIPLKRGGWQLYGYLPKTVMLSATRPLFVVISVTAALFLLMLCLMISMMRKQILKPISQLSGFMAHVPSDVSPVRFAVTTDNELGQMIGVMNRMLDELDEKSEQVRHSEAHAYEAEIFRKDMEVLAYRNQINPHFLYNTLDCICAMAMYHGADQIVKVSQSLSTMFRYAVKGDSIATIREEIAYVQEYALIIGARFTERIRIRVTAEESTLPCRTIRLLLQPLVENAVFHGLEKQIGEGTVSVSISAAEGEKLTITVQDDGIGIDAQTLSELRKNISLAQSDAPAQPSTMKSIGLTNIARRIHLYYGTSGQINIDSTEGQGTRVTLVLPPLEGENRDDA